MGKYKVFYDEKARCISMLLSGYFTDEDGVNFVNDFIELSNKFKTDETYLTLDCGLLYIYPCNIYDKLKDVFKLYKDFGYKLVRFKVFNAQKEMTIKFKELCDFHNLSHDVFIVDI